MEDVYSSWSWPEPEIYVYVQAVRLFNKFPVNNSHNLHWQVFGGGQYTALTYT